MVTEPVRRLLRSYRSTLVVWADAGSTQAARSTTAATSATARGCRRSARASRASLRHVAAASGIVRSSMAGSRYEGLVAKDPASPYLGGRTLKWLKVKQRDYRVEER